MSYTNQIGPGQPLPLGAHCVVNDSGIGVNFALWSENAEQVELCVFSGDEETRYALPECHNGIWHGFLPGAGAGLVYGYRVHGAYEPGQGHRFNPAKLLIDPYARQLQGALVADERLMDFEPDARSWRPDPRDNAAVMPKAVVVESQFDWQGVSAPAVPLQDSVIYELHVRGFTARHPQVPEQLRGTYLGLAQPVVIEYLQQLGVTAIELLPCASFVSETHLLERNLTNHWGYNPLSFFAPHAAYSCGDPIGEFQSMVRAMHDAGIEVLVDVVYNHTAEGGARGPTYSFRGIDNAAYYSLRQHDRSAYVNNSGCGNSLNTHHPAVLRLVLDSLRFWAEVLHVDGFRFDLAPALARVHGEYDYHAPFLQALYQDPVLSKKKLIAEPWDVGHAGYRLGQFPPGWSEWNDRYRATVRQYWRGDQDLIGRMASRLAGSSDIFSRRGPVAGINYVAAHDGFTLADTVSYEEKHNLANGEDNRDGEQHNNSWNNGVEGETDDPGILLKRQRDVRAMLATLMFSQGIPMLLAGDELGRSQRGNNNAYCQDNEISWLDWENADWSLAQYVARLIALRRNHAVFRRREFLVGAFPGGAAVHDVQWLTRSGMPMQLADWRDEADRCFAMLLRGDLAADAISPRYRLDADDALLLFNGADTDTVFDMPMGTGPWQVAVESMPAAAQPQGSYRLSPRSVVLLLSPNG